jgi:hypothetical protein
MCGEVFYDWRSAGVDLLLSKMQGEPLLGFYQRAAKGLLKR